MSSLTQRETEVMSLICSGLSNKEIARALGIRIDTVKQHVSQIMLKLDAPNRAAAVAVWVNGHHSPPPKVVWTRRMMAA
jgi:DNA-binding CsgD family transcriptional regulator